MDQQSHPRNEIPLGKRNTKKFVVYNCKNKEKITSSLYGSNKRYRKKQG